MTNGFVPDFDVFNPDCDSQAISKIFEESRHFRSYWTGNFEPLAEATLENTGWSGFHFYREDSGMLMLFRRERSEEESRTIQIKDVEASAQYTLRITDEAFHEQEQTVTGKALREGWTFTIGEPRSSLAVEYVRIDG